MPPDDPETRRLREDAERKANWKRWGPYLSERQWATVREDYSANGDPWSYFPHEHAHLRAYRWGEDGLLGITDREGRLCFALALWNGQDPILKERMFGLTGPEGNHGEDAKDVWFYLDSTPTHSYMKALYKYPQSAFPYQRLRDENKTRGRLEQEFDLEDSGCFDDGRYFDVYVEYAKAGPDDLLIRITFENRGPDPFLLHALPTLWFRNTWSWGRHGEGYLADRPSIRRIDASSVRATHPTLGALVLQAAGAHEILFTENDTNAEKLWGAPNRTPHTKDAFHRRVVDGDAHATNPGNEGTKAAFWYKLEVPAQGRSRIELRLHTASDTPTVAFGPVFDRVFHDRIAEADRFYEARYPATASAAERSVLRTAWAGLLWTKQFYHYIPGHWLEGDPNSPAPPEERYEGRNVDWSHSLYNRDVVSMPDKWEYPWYAAWDLAFHMIPFARIDGEFAKGQLELFLREWYMHPNGQLPAYEWNFSDVNPPVHAWAAWRVYKLTAPRGQRDRRFLAHVFLKLLMNFTWWVNRKDEKGKNLFSGGFLGLDNIGAFDRSRPLPGGGTLEQADGTAWMAFYSVCMLGMAIELSQEDLAYQDLASKFFEHFVAIADAMNTLGGSGLWDEEDGFYYDQLRIGDRQIPMKIRSMVGIIPLFTALVIDDQETAHMPGFRKRMEWFLSHRPHLARQIASTAEYHGGPKDRWLLAIPSRDRIVRVLKYVLDENEFLSPFGVRSLSRIHGEEPFVLRVEGHEYRVGYVPGDSDNGLFGGNSNWRGPIWFPLNFLLIEALERLYYFFGDALRVECPTGSGTWMNLKEVGAEIGRRLATLFLPGPDGHRPCMGGDERFATDPHWKDLVWFHEFFHGDTGRGLGACHQTGWTALVVSCIESQHRPK
jgi:hypothetical protein